MAHAVESTSRRARWIQGIALAVLILGLATSGPYGFAVRRQSTGALVLLPTPMRAAAYWLAWAAAIPMLIAASRIPLDMGRRYPARLVCQVALALAGSGAHAVVFWVIEGAGWDFPSPSRALVNPPSVWLEMARGLWEYLLFLAFIHIVSFRRIVDDQARQAAGREMDRVRLESALARAQLSALQSQLHPHFLFNTLNSISVLVPRDPAAAQTMILQLGTLLRSVMADRSDSLVPLRDEIDLLDRYLAIQRVRFRDRLSIELKIGEDTLDALIPSLLLQPLVENAIRHAVEVAGGGTIILVARRLANELELSVEDQGAGAATAASTGLGVGLDNVRQRLALLFGNAAQVKLEPRIGGGTIASVSLPFELQAKQSE